MTAVSSPARAFALSSSSLAPTPAQAALISEPASPTAISHIGPADGIDVWDDLAGHIDEFAVAKAIADHFDAFPAALQSMPELDLLGLYLRAKVTIKRHQIAFAEARRLEERPRASSRSKALACVTNLVPVACSGLQLLRATGQGLWRGLRLTVLSHPAPAAALVMGLALGLR